MFNRRQLLIGTAATAAAISLPAIASPISSNPVLDSVLKFIASDPQDKSRYYGCSDALNDYELDVAINTSLITRYPELFPADRHLFSGCPSSMFYNGIERASYGVLSMMYNHRCYMNLTVIPDFTDLEHVVDEIALNIKEQQSCRFYLNGNMFSLIPAMAVRTVDTNTYQPLYRFKTRFAAVPTGFHILTAEEDQKIWNEEQRRLVAY